MTNIDWIDRAEYPFKSNYMQLPMGRMHYVDEGSGEPIVMLHGNPTWSFLYRNMVKALSAKYRCIAIDLMGFGLSDKPPDWPYHPEGHAENLALFMDKLGLKDITLVMQDWGGPIGMSYAIDNPDNVKRLIIMNTWAWPVRGDKHYERFSAFMGGSIGRFLIKRFNFFVRVFMKKAMADPALLTRHIHSHYLNALPNAESRKGCYVFPRRIIESTPWLESLWNRRDSVKNKPALILWGMKDIAFRQVELDRWKGLFLNRKVVELTDAGHFVQEEAAPEINREIEEFMIGAA